MLSRTVKRELKIWKKYRKQAENKLKEIDRKIEQLRTYKKRPLVNRKVSHKVKRTNTKKVKVAKTGLVNKIMAIFKK